MKIKILTMISLSVFSISSIAMDSSIELNQDHTRAYTRQFISQLANSDGTTNIPRPHGATTIHPPLLNSTVATVVESSTNQKSQSQIYTISVAEKEDEILEASNDQGQGRLLLDNDEEKNEDFTWKSCLSESVKRVFGALFWPVYILCRWCSIL